MIQAMNFLQWYFETHWIWATVLTPFTTFLWALYTDATGWAWGCAGVWFTYAIVKASAK